MKMCLLFGGQPSQRIDIGAMRSVWSHAVLPANEMQTSPSTTCYVSRHPNEYRKGPNTREVSCEWKEKAPQRAPWLNQNIFYLGYETIWQRRYNQERRTRYVTEQIACVSYCPLLAEKLSKLTLSCCLSRLLNYEAPLCTLTLHLLE